jgi:hypothetical protein
MIKKIRNVKKILLITIYGRHKTRSTYDLSVRTEVGRKTTTKCTSYT